MTLPSDVIPVVISKANFDILLSQGRSFEEYFDAVGDDRLRRTHTEVLPEEEFPPAEEMYPPATDEAPAVEDSMDVELDDVLKDELQAEPEPEVQPQRKEQPKKPDVPPPAPKKPVAPPAVPKKQTPDEPEIPEGSEGDDPLLD